MHTWGSIMFGVKLPLYKSHDFLQRKGVPKNDNWNWEFSEMMLDWPSDFGGTMFSDKSIHTSIYIYIYIYIYIHISYHDICHDQ